MQQCDFKTTWWIAAFVLLLGLTTALGQSSNPKAKPSTRHHRKSRRHSAKSHGQQKIDPQRAEQIQEALVREHYLTEAPSGVWDDASQKAMERFQAANGWQSKVVPDSRALIKLGLGPDHEHLLNPESAMTSPPSLSAKPATDAAQK